MSRRRFGSARAGKRKCPAFRAALGSGLVMGATHVAARLPVEAGGGAQGWRWPIDQSD
jgi:hypothetical protein